MKVEKKNGWVDWNFLKNVPNFLSSGSKEVKSKISVDSHATPTAFFSLFFKYIFLLGFYFYFRFRSSNILQIARENSGMAGRIGMMDESISGTYCFYNFNNVTVTATIFIRLY